MFGAALGFLGRAITSPIGRAAGGWVLQKAGNFLGKYAKKAADYVMKSPFGGVIRKIGPAVADFVGEKTFNTAMRQFGDTIQNKIDNSQLAPVLDGKSVGDAYHSGMSKVYDFMRNGGNMQSPADQGGMPGQQVERQLQETRAY